MENTKSCCMIGCLNLSSSDGKSLFGFPTDFNLCMLWVQNSGKPEHFEDFAFGGAQPFLNRYICCDHFPEKDFIDAENKNLGLLPGSVPKLNIAISQVNIKEECFDSEYATALNIMPDIEVLSEIKFEKSESDTCDDEVGANFSFSSNDDSGNDLHTSKGPLSENDAEEIKLSNDFFRDYNKAMNRISRRSNESEKARLVRLKKEALRAKMRRSQETEEQTKIRRMKNALRAAFRRKNETPEQRETRRIKDLLRTQKKRKSETETQTKIRKYNDAVRAAHRRKNETEEERRDRRMKDMMRAAKRRSMETLEQRQVRLSKDRERASKKRMLKKIFEQMSRLNKSNGMSHALPVPINVQMEEAAESDTDSTSLSDSTDSTPLTMSSLGYVVGHCSERSNMERLQEVLQFIRKKVRAKPKSKKLTESSDSSQSFMAAEDDSTNEDDGMYPADDSRYQQNILNFLSWNRLHPQMTVEEVISNEGLGRVSEGDGVRVAYSINKSPVGSTSAFNEDL